MRQSPEMTAALADETSYAAYRMECVEKVLGAADTYGVKWRDQDVLDLGCFDGAISAAYLNAGAATVVGVDIDEPAIQRARTHHSDSRLRFVASGVNEIPLENRSVDTIISYDVFEHVRHPGRILRECHRILRPGGQMLIGTWGWYHPFAPHLWSIMPVPYAHVFFSERTLLRTCHRIYKSDDYVPNMHDFDSEGNRIEDKFLNESISEDYLNKFLIRDFERCFRESDLQFRIHSQRFSTKYAVWTKPLLKIPFIREFVTAYIWVVMEKSHECSTTHPRHVPNMNTGCGQPDRTQAQLNR